MENNIPLFEDYLFERLSPTEKLEFDERLKSDKAFASDFRVFLIVVKGICKEAEQDNVEFAYAMRHISKADLLKIIGRHDIKRSWPRRIIFERMAWAACVAVILVTGIIVLNNVRRSGEYALDNTLVAYTYIPTPPRGGGDEVMDINVMTDSQLKAYIPQLWKAYDSADPDDIQECEMAGMQLAMAYLKLHDRKQAKALLSELAARFADDEAFAAQCKAIITQLE